MRRTIAALLVSLSIVAGGALGFVAVDVNDGRALAGQGPAEPSPSSAPAPTVATAVPGYVVPGAIGPVRAGMSVADAVETGYVERDRERERICGQRYYRWTGDLREDLDLYTYQGVVTDVGMLGPRVETPNGITVGDTLRSLRDAYGPDLSGPITLDYGNVGFMVSDGDDWVGFGFEAGPDAIGAASRITLIQVTSGSRPGLMRDGC
ncbi:hypothetical protein CLV56_1500 [Mumia flava]|uniref:Uncharacterized protein n=1 Tax=Mumia flava TaxID=1348852 RepID=A0A0B2BTN6_9ACTN|nr:hypothetical protein [Mumia flava]PJJ57273.1 hypothetical protein CLV56_1500 [Mumia flava]